ncbi:MAG TPA: hypothetical protein VLA84_01875 [Microcoleus sp.]|nr:hypothetical protein [Microcoleus sp.]
MEDIVGELAPCSWSPMLEVGKPSSCHKQHQPGKSHQPKGCQPGFLAIDCYAKTGNPPSAGSVNNS